MEKILIVSGNEKASAAIIGLLKDIFPSCDLSMINSSIEARKIVAEKQYDTIIINCPLPDEFGSELAEIIYDSSMASCVMIVKNDVADAVGERMEELGVMVIPKPLSKHTFYHSMRFINASRKRLLGLQTENLKLHKKLEEIRIVNRAKFALMQYLNFTEQQAHKYLEKQAMDTRTAKVDVAMKIIKMYDN